MESLAHASDLKGTVHSSAYSFPPHTVTKILPYVGCGCWAHSEDGVAGSCRMGSRKSGQDQQGH